MFTCKIAGTCWYCILQIHPFNSMDEAVAQLNHILKASCIYGFCTYAHTHRVNKQQKKIGPRLSKKKNKERGDFQKWKHSHTHTHTQTQCMNCETFNTRPPVYNYGQEKRKKQK